VGSNPTPSVAPWAGGARTPGLLSKGYMPDVEDSSPLSELRRSLDAAARQPSAAREAGHRPWPPPRSPWVLAQTWEDPCFLHWPVEVAALRRAVPPQLPVETFEERAWLTITPLYIRASRPRLVPPLYPWASFPELNLRTYTTVGGKPGVYFLSLDCPSAVSVAAARAIFRLPYRLASMRMRREGARTLQRSRRIGPGPLPARLAVGYEPVGDPANAVPGSLDHWLLERYCCYGVDRVLGVLRTEIQHPPWQIRGAEIELRENTLASAHGVPVHGEPLAHTCQQQDVLFWAPQRAGRRG
jgi:uncharacterized protein